MHKNRHRIVAGWVALAGLLVLASGCQTPTDDGPPVLLFSANNQGVLAACGCPSNPSGGLAKRQGLVEQYRRTRRHILLVDGGDLFPDYEHAVKVEYVARAVGRAGYDAIGLGDQEFALGLDRLRELASTYRLPFVGANVRDSSGRLAFPPHVVREVGGRRIGIFAVIADRAYGWPPREWRKGLQVEPPIEAARREVKALADCDLRVAISHQPLSDTRQLAAEVPGLDVVISGHDETVLPKGEKIGHVLLVGTGESGRILGAIILGKGKAGSTDPPRRASLALDMTELSAHVPEATWVMDLYWDYVKEAKDQPPPDWNDAPIPAAYEPAETCGACHPAEVQQWLTTRHARAYESIRKAGRQEDPECLLCHTMGPGRQGGFVSIQKTPGLARVTCQACHIVTSDHAKKKIKPEPQLTIHSRLCMTCHGPVQSPDFDYFVAKPKILHRPPADESKK